MSICAVIDVRIDFTSSVIDVNMCFLAPLEPVTGILGYESGVETLLAEMTA